MIAAIIAELLWGVAVPLSFSALFYQLLAYRRMARTRAQQILQAINDRRNAELRYCPREHAEVAAWADLMQAARNDLVLHIYDDMPLVAHTPDAYARSLNLLEEHLSPEQLLTFKAHNFFDVVGSATATRYRIDRRFNNFNIFVIDDRGQVCLRLCFEPTKRLPIGDVLLTQKIYLENDELEALRVANKHPAHPHELQGLWP